MRIIAILFCAFVSTLALGSAYGLPVSITMDDSLEKLSIGSSVAFFLDEKGARTIREVADPRFDGRWFYPGEANPGFGFSTSVYWARFSVRNDTESDVSFYLEHAYPLVDDLTLYSPMRNGYRSIRTGDRLNYSERPYDHRTFVFQLTSPAHSITTYYLRQKTSSAMYFPLHIWSPESFAGWARYEDRLLMFYYGIMIIMAFNYLCVYLLIRHISYLYFSMFIISVLLFIMSQLGATFQLIVPGFPGLANIAPPFFLCLANLFGNRFILVFLQLRKHAPAFKKAVDIQVLIIILALVSVILIPLFDLYRAVMTGTAFLSVVSIMTGFSAGALLVYRRQRSAYIFAVISSGFFIGSILYLMRTFGLLPGSFITTWSIVIGSSTMLLVLSIAMVDRINIMRKGLKRLAGNLEREVTERSIELLLSEIASKVMDDRSGRRNETRKAGVDSPKIQTLLDYQRDLTIKKLSHDISIISNVEELQEKAIMMTKEMSRARSVFLFVSARDGEIALRSSAGIVDRRKLDRAKKIAAGVIARNELKIVRASDEKRRGKGSHITCIPVRHAGEAIGAGYFERDPSDVEFSESDARLLIDFSERMTGVYENALSYRKQMLRDEYRKKYSITQQTEDKIKQAAAYIREHYMRDISREGLAASLDISPNHLGKYFKVYTGKRISEYINELRIREAARMLREKKEENVINIAFSVGFESLSTFNRAFMRIMGITPTEYKDRD